MCNPVVFDLEFMSCFEIPSFLVRVCSPTVFRLEIGCEKYFTLIWNQLFYSWKGSKEPANSSYFNICPEMIRLRNMELIVGSSYDFYVIYVILSNHYEIAAKAHLSHSWEPLRFFTWRQQQI